MAKDKKTTAADVPPAPAPETTSETAAAAPPAPLTSKCAGCDNPLAEEDLAIGADFCAACRLLLDRPAEEPLPKSEAPEEPEVEDDHEDLPEPVADAAGMFGLRAEHIQGYAVRDRTVTIVTKGGKRVSLTVEADGRRVMVGPDGSKWYQSAHGGFIARDDEGRVGRDVKGDVLRIPSGAQLLHDRDRGIAAPPAPSLYPLFGQK